MGYKGFIQLALRSGQYKTINAREVRQGELIEEDFVSGEMKFKRADNRETLPITGYVAYYELVNGARHTIYMTRQEIEAHAKKYSQSYKNDKYGTSQWTQNFDCMALKTVLKLLLSKWGILSIEMERAVTFDQSNVPGQVNAIETDFDEINPEYIDNQPEAIQQDPDSPALSKAESVEARANAIHQRFMQQKQMQEASEQFKKGGQ